MGGTKGPLTGFSFKFAVEILYFIVNNTLHELYFGRIVIFWIKYNKAPAELYLIHYITNFPKEHCCRVLFISKKHAKNIPVLQ